MFNISDKKNVKEILFLGQKKNLTAKKVADIFYICIYNVSTVTSGSQVIRVLPCQIFKISTCRSKKDLPKEKKQNVLIFLPENLVTFFSNSSATAYIEEKNINA